MAISEDLRSYRRHSCRAELDNAPLLRLVCSNLQSIAEQIESLENLPLATRDIAGKTDAAGGNDAPSVRCNAGEALLAIAVDDSQ